MGNRLLISFILFLSILAESLPSTAQVFGAPAFLQSQSANWWRNGATLDLDFLNDRYYLNGTVYSGISNFLTASSTTFSRTSTATYYDSSGTLQTAASNVPRLNYEPSTQLPRGILIEEQGTNVLLQSSNMSISPWTKASALSMSTAAGTAPDGTNTAVLVTASGSGLSYFYQTGLPTDTSLTFTRSMYVKAGTTSNIYFEFNDPTNCATFCIANFNLSTVTASWVAVKTGEGTVSITAVKNGWYRISATMTYSSAATAEGFVTYVGTYGSGTGTVYIWGAQLEQKAFVTSYIPTTTATVTRAADNFAIPTAAWMNSTMGTFLGQGFGQINSTQNGYSRMLGGVSPISYLGFNSIGSGNMNIWNGTTYLVTPCSFSYPSLVTPVKMAFAWSDLSMTLSSAATSSALGTKTYGGSWSSTYIYPGGSSYDPLNAEVQRITYFPTAMPDQYLKDMTL